MLLTEQQVLLSAIFPMQAKESLVPEESEERFTGGFLSQTSMQTQLSYNIAGQMLIEVNTWIWAGEEWLELKADMERTSFHLNLFNFCLFFLMVQCVVAA